MKADRLYGITLYLLNHKRASGRCLADTFEVSLRCIQRDMDTLSMAGVPIIAYSGVNGGYELQEGYKLPAALVKEQDYAIIAASLDSMESAGLHKEVQTAKLLFPKHEEDTLGVQLDFSVANETAIEQRRLLQSVIAARHSVTFQYTDAQGKQTKRFCEAVALIFRWYAWYLVGWDVDKQAYRMYKLVRMEQLQEAEHTNRKHPCLREILKQLMRRIRRLSGRSSCTVNRRPEAECWNIFREPSWRYMRTHPFCIACRYQSRSISGMQAYSAWEIQYGCWSRRSWWNA